MLVVVFGFVVSEFGLVLVVFLKLWFFGFGCMVMICLCCRLFVLLVVIYVSDVVLIVLWFITLLFCGCVFVV